MRKLFTPLIMVFAMTHAFAQAVPHTPAQGSPERTAILAAARTPVEKALGQPVQFVVKKLNVIGGWAYLFANMQTPRGQPISYDNTPFAAEAEHGQKSDGYMVLLQAKDGKWVVRADKIGPTDVAWVPWPKQFDVPEALFGSLPGSNR